ncbi:tryptophan 7-halogenase [Embleya hyalina]|uniref:FAD-dependent oxidoreductase n=1 Tax=Embleya hyalina TaxID=516124 RepID=A0A401Z071_9ACTN|nr:tryptophan 7-halogenase [Embleya hyalina]GCE00249.1 FAD-dependent oxidoreductase [Embleya hyalina]
MTGAGAPPVRRRHEVIVAGGGPAGASAAITLARAGRSVLLADAGSGPPAIGEALPAAAGRLLADLGVAEHVPGPGHLPCHATVSAWGSAHPATVSSIVDPYGSGRHLDRALFDARLREGARAAGAEVAEHTRVGVPTRRPDGRWAVPLRRGDRHEVAVCDRLVDATGRRASIATGVGGAHRRTRDALIALHLTLPDVPASYTDASTLVESAPDGWWYTALVPGDRLLLAYFTDADAPTLGPGRDVAFRAHLAETTHTAARVAAVPFPRDPAPRRAPAHSAHLDRVFGDGWIAVGDAAAAFDPLSSQGILTALYTGLTAAEALDASLSGHPNALAVYRDRITSVLSAYHRNHHDAYTAERRWPDHPFWRRRHARTTPPAVVD